MSRIAPLHYRKTAYGFVPVSSGARDFHAKTKMEQLVELKGRRPRNPKHHKKLFALLSILADNCEEFDSAEDALVGIKAVLGRGTWKKLHRKAEREVFRPESIAFDAMGQDEFEEFYTAAVAAVRRWWLPVSDDDLREAVEAFAA